MTTATRSVIYVDSNSDDEEFQPKTLRSNNNRKRGRQNAKSTKTRRSSKRGKKPIVINDDDSLTLQDDSFSTELLPLSSYEPQSTFNPESVTENADPIRTIDVLMDENATTLVASPPRKTARRGLARRQCEQKVSDSTALAAHKVSVYSQAIAEGFKSLMHGVGPYGAETAVDDAGNIVTTETKEIDTELSSTDVNSRLTEAQKVFSHPDTIGSEGEAHSPNDSIRIQSPSPPPPPQLHAKPARKMNKKLTMAFNALSRAKVSLSCITPPTPAGKRSKKRDSDVIIVGEEAAGANDILVKVRYLTNVHRLMMKLNEPFHVLVKKLSKEINADEHNLGLFLRDVSLKVTETPNSVKLSVADIIECHCIKVSENSVSSSDAIELVIQCSNSRSKTTLIANRRRPLSDVMQKYAQLMNDVLDSFVFSFDGEDIEPSDTPSKLDMEDHDVIDVAHH